MLRSSISRLRRWAGATDRSVGIAIGKSEIAAVGVSAGSGSGQVQWVRSVPPPPGWFSGEPSPAHADALSAALVQLVPETRNKFTPVHVALPDPLGAAAVFELEGLPQHGSMRRQLAHWRIAKDLGYADDDIDVAYQDLGNAGAKRLLLSQAIPARWLAQIKTALAKAGVTAWSINQALGFRFNAHHERFAADRAPGALLALDSDAWTMAAWDAAARLRFVRARWRRFEKDSPQTESQRIVNEFEQAVLAYVNADPLRSVEHIYVAIVESERELLTTELNRRLHRPCIPLVSDRLDEHRSSVVSGAAELALIAARA